MHKSICGSRHTTGSRAKQAASQDWVLPVLPEDDRDGGWRNCPKLCDDKCHIVGRHRVVHEVQQACTRTQSLLNSISGRLEPCLRLVVTHACAEQEDINIELKSCCGIVSILHSRRIMNTVIGYEISKCGEMHVFRNVYSATNGGTHQGGEWSASRPAQRPRAGRGRR